MLAFLNVVITCSTALQAAMDKMKQMERSMEHIRVDYKESMKRMERSMEQMRVENQRSMNIGPEMDQEIDTNVHQ